MPFKKNENLGENFPGYPKGIMGPEMMDDLKVQAERFGRPKLLKIDSLTYRAMAVYGE